MSIVPGRYFAIFTLVMLLATVLCRIHAIPSQASASQGTATSAIEAFEAVSDQTHLHNAHLVTEKVISGAQPEGDQSFEALRDLGVKTIISVDGAAPDVAGAKKFGMRYVHLPIGYDGVAPEEGKAIAKAVSELPGKIYIHCHHGKHRSAAATAVACVYSRQLPPEQAEAVLHTFGTGENYKGLWQAARDARPIDAESIAAFDVTFVERATIGDFAEFMVAIDQGWEHVKQIQKAGWKAPADHPDLDAAHEVLMVQEHLTESARLRSSADRPAEFQRLLGESGAHLKSLADILDKQPVDTRAADAAFKLASRNCTACHATFRD